MALDLTAEQKATGQANFQRVVGKLAEDSRLNRREFMQGLIGAGTVLPLTAAAYFGYGRDASYRTMRGNPVKAALIGCGDEGGVLASEHDPEYVQIVSVCDIRPTNKARIFDGEGIESRRKGLKYYYGNDADKNIPVVDDYRTILADRNIEMVIIALPLNLHHKVTMDALEAGKHVLCEKLMAWNITQCKEMIRKADEKRLLLSIGHQRHYSMLYAHANEIVKSGVLGDVRHIRALWHRNNTTPKLDAQGRPVMETVNGREIPVYSNDGWRKSIEPADRQALESTIRTHGWKDLNELIRWRLFRRTGGGLMAELGSHQLDACSIFLDKKKPLSVTAVGGKNFYNDDREVEDHVYCTFEFPGKTYDPTIPRETNGDYNYNDIVTVTYSSLSTNSFENYGECVMGSRGTLITEREQSVYLYGSPGRSTAVTANATSGRPVLEASSSTAAPAEARAQAVGSSSVGPAVSYGYREEMSHLAYCIRNRNEGMQNDREQFKPRCDGRAAMADAIIALTANQAMRRRERIEFQPDWFDASKDDVPDANMRAESV
ncbi:MAG: Gfo/Idh/MocA family oxidoreductase [Planctomycetota bacterium]